MYLCSVAESCLTLWDPMDCNLPGPSVHRIFQARILEWVLQGIFPTQESNPGPLALFSCCFFLNFYLYFNWWKIVLQLRFDFCYIATQLIRNIDSRRYR